MAVSARAAGVHRSLGDALAIEVRQPLEQVHVLDETLCTGAGGLRALAVADRNPRVVVSLGWSVIVMSSTPA